MKPACWPQALLSAPLVVCLLLGAGLAASPVTHWGPQSNAYALMGLGLTVLGLLLGIAGLLGARTVPL